MIWYIVYTYILDIYDEDPKYDDMHATERQESFLHREYLGVPYGPKMTEFLNRFSINIDI